VRALFLSLLVCAAVAAIVFTASGGRVIFLPLVLLLPLGLFALGRTRSRADGP
jgi:hypothetical protein